MITKPKLKPMPGMVEVEYNGRRMYRNIKTGEIVAPGSVVKTENIMVEEIIDALLGVTTNE